MHICEFIEINLGCDFKLKLRNQGLCPQSTTSCNKHINLNYLNWKSTWNFRLPTWTYQHVLTERKITLLKSGELTLFQDGFDCELSRELFKYQVDLEEAEGQMWLGLYFYTMATKCAWACKWEMYKKYQICIYFAFFTQQKNAAFIYSIVQPKEWVPYIGIFKYLLYI